MPETIPKYVTTTPPHKTHHASEAVRTQHAVILLMSMYMYVYVYIRSTYSK